MTDSILGREQSPPLSVEMVSRCGACGCTGQTLYADIEDRLFGVPGRWSVSRCENTACGALWLNPRPTAADIGKAYQTYYTHGEGDPDSIVKRIVKRLALERSRAVHDWPKLPTDPILGRLLLAASRLYPGLSEHVDLMTRYVAPPQRPGSARLLDIGCGDGEALAILKDLGWRVEGLETDPAAASAARRRGLDVHQGMLEDAGYVEGSFDVVTSSHVVEHVHDPVKHLQYVRSLLREGGAFVAITPNVRCLSHRRHGRFWRGLEVPRHIMVHTPESLARIAAMAGFGNVRVFTTSRAVSLSEIAANQVRAGQTPALTVPPLMLKLRALLTQWRESSLHRDDTMTGNEIVLIARR